jgi:hypothetical protein
VLEYIPDDRDKEGDVLLCHVIGIFELGLIQLILRVLEERFQNHAHLEEIDL